MKKLLSRNKTVKIAIFLTSFVLSIAILFNLFSNPLESSKSISYIFLLVLFAICANLGLDILRNFINFSQRRWVFYTIQWILTFLIPISLVVLIEHPLQKRIMADVSKEMKPTLDYIQTYKNNKGTLPIKIKQKNDIKLRYYRKGKFYLLATDIYPSNSDKEIIYFNSRDNKWYRFYNDQYDYYKDKKVVPQNLKEYLWFIKQQ